MANSFVKSKVTKRNPQTSNGIFFQLRQLDYFCLVTTDITSFLEWFDIRCRWMLWCYFINIGNIGYGVDPRMFPQNIIDDDIFEQRLMAIMLKTKQPKPAIATDNGWPLLDQ